MLRIKIPASTSNIGPGFDVFGLALSLYLRIDILKTSNGKTRVMFQGEGENLINPENNMIVKTINDIFTGRKREVPDYELKVKNEIPVCSGLGSSGTAVIAGIICADYLGGYEMTCSDILLNAAQIEGHPDNITPSFNGGFTSSLIDENGKLYFRKQRLPKGLSVVFVIPDIIILTKEARNILPQSYNIKDIVFNMQRTALMLDSIRLNDYTLLSRLLEDRLHQPYRKSLVPGMDEVLSLKPSKGLIGTFISGSGPAVGAFVTGDIEETGEKIRAIFERNNLNARVMQLKPDNTGTKITGE